MSEKNAWTQKVMANFESCEGCGMTIAFSSDLPQLLRVIVSLGQCDVSITMIVTLSHPYLVANSGPNGDYCLELATRRERRLRLGHAWRCRDSWHGLPREVFGHPICPSFAVSERPAELGHPSLLLRLRDEFNAFFNDGLSRAAKLRVRGNGKSSSRQRHVVPGRTTSGRTFERHSSAGQRNGKRASPARVGAVGEATRVSRHQRQPSCGSGRRAQQLPGGGALK